MVQIPTRQLFIGGQWVAPAQGGSLPIINPATEQEVGRIAAATPADVDRAVAAAVATAKNGTRKPCFAGVQRLLDWVSAAAPEPRGCISSSVKVSLHASFLLVALTGCWTRTTGKYRAGFLRAIAAKVRFLLLQMAPGLQHLNKLVPPRDCFHHL
jgi:hypothetical protein